MLSVNDVQGLPQRQKRKRRGQREKADDSKTTETQDMETKEPEETSGDLHDNGDETTKNDNDNNLTNDDHPQWPSERKIQYEYLEHTADVQLHSWGSTLAEAFESSAIAMFGYMTELDTVTIDDSLSFEFEAKGHDMQSLLFSFLDELLFNFSCEPFMCCKDVRIQEFDEANFTIKAIGRGEVFDLSKHPQGTEVKAITYSAMQIETNWKARNEKEENMPGASDPCHVFVVIDI